MGACKFNVNSSDHCHGCENELRAEIAQLREKANNLARLVEQTCYAPVAGYYEQYKNDAPLKLLRPDGGGRGCSYREEKMRLECKYEVQAAHQLSAGVPVGHPCRRLHGHRYNIVVTIIGDVNPETGMIMEYEEIDERVWEVLSMVDHYNLNEVGLQLGDDLKPTAVLRSDCRQLELAERVRKNSTVENFVTWLKAELETRFPHASQTVGVLSFLRPQIYAVRIEEDADHTVEL